MADLDQDATVTTVTAAVMAVDIGGLATGALVTSFTLKIGPVQGKVMVGTATGTRTTRNKRRSPTKDNEIYGRKDGYT